MTQDPFNVATEVGNAPKLYFGEVDITASFVVLVKGQGKFAYDERQHPVKDRRTEVQITLIPLPESGLTNPVSRSIIAESKEWAGTVWPSLRDLGVKNAREIQGRFASIELVDSGRTWNDKQTGEERKGTTIKFVELFDDEMACLAAWRAARGDSGDEPARPSTPAANDNGAGSSADKEAIKAFLPALVKQSGGDREKLRQIIDSNAMVKKHFTIDSPEVVALLEMPF